MRRRAITILVLAVIVAAFFGTWRIAYRMGESDGRNTVAAARAAFLSRSGGAQQPGGSGQQAAGGRQAAGSGSAVSGTTASGSAQTGSGQRAAGGGSAVSGTAVSSLTGHVTAIDRATVSLQQADNTMVTVTTDGATAIEKLVAGALSDLKTGDVIAVDGTKTGDAAYSAKTITNLGQRAAGGGRQAAGSRQSAVGSQQPAVTGQIKSMDNGTITVQGFDGATVTVTSSPATVVKARQPGTLADIKTGDLLVVQGEKTGDTGFLARSIINQGASG